MHAMTFETKAARQAPAVVAAVRLPLTPAQWADLANKEGRFLGVCCANIATIRDHLIDALREDGWIDTNSLRDVVRLAIGHDLTPAAAPDPASPWPTIFAAWTEVQSRTQPGLLSRPDIARDPTDLHDATRIVAHSALWLLADDLANRDPRPACAAGQQVERALAIVRFAPAIQTLAARLADLWPGDFTGVACVRVEAPTAIIETAGGLAVFAQAEDAAACLAYWRTGDPAVDAKVRVRPVRVTLAGGLAFLDAEVAR